jgi:type 1 glutamine amidotransferase
LKLIHAWLLIALASGCAVSAAGQPNPDCPLAHQSYSTRTPLLDLQLDPAARTILDRLVPDLVSRLTADHGGGDLPPGFAAIIAPDWLLHMQPDGSELAMRLDAELAKVVLTPRAIQARCARYDATPPRLPRHIARPAVLVFDKINGYRDDASVAAAATALRGLAAQRGWTLVFSDNGAVFNRRDLARFDAVVWNNVSGDALTLTQQRAFRGWLEHGGGYAGIHGSGGDPIYLWDWYADVLVGARFAGHPMAPQFQPARVIVEDPHDPLTRDLGGDWTMTEEWYSFATSPRLRGAHILARLDESSYAPLGFGGQDLHMGDHPIAWTQCIGRGRSFYTAIGHRPESYSEPHASALLEQGIAWAAGLGDRRCATTPAVAQRVR